MESVIVEIYIPATNKTFDFALPAQGRIDEVTSCIIETLEFTEKNVVFNTACPMLCDLSQETALQPSMTVVDAGVRDGARLMLL